MVADIDISQDYDDKWTSDGGGPAYPSSRNVCAGAVVSYPGMSVRDYFAGQALAGLLSASASDGAQWQSVAQDAYAAADAMLAVRAVDKNI